VAPPRKLFRAEVEALKRQGKAPPALAAEGPVAAPALSGGGGPAGADAAEILSAIADLGAKLDRYIHIESSDLDRVQAEVAEIAGRIKATKLEMAALRHPLANQNKFRDASEELAQIVRATEEATNTILACAEEIDQAAAELRGAATDDYMAQRLSDISDLTARVFESCNFQDLTGQKITKIVKTLAFVEERIDRMLAQWNPDELAALPLPPELVRVDGDVELHGPDLSDGAEEGTASQADIDALFD